MIPRSTFVGIASVLFALLILNLERLFGIGADFHPDAMTYTVHYEEVVMQGASAIPNQLYFFISAALGGSINALITLNIIAYGLTNCLLLFSFERYIAIRKQLGLRTPHVNWILLLIIASPYRVHLAVHALKDTIIIFLLCLAAYNSRRLAASGLSWLALILMRTYSFLYVPVFVTGKRLLILGAVIGLPIVAYHHDYLIELLLERNEADMRAREFDLIPTFADMGVAGSILRAITWPMLLLSGTFTIISPSAFFLPLAAELVAFQAWSRFVFFKFGITFGALLALTAIAASVTSFTAYARYAYPLISVLPIIIMRSQRAIHASRNNRKNRKDAERPR